MKTRILALSVSAAIVLTTMTPVETSANEPTVSIQLEPHPNFSSLRTHRQAKGITATWSMTGLDGVLCFTVEKTYEDPTEQYAYWEPVADLPCRSSRSFSYTDKEVFAGNIHYRVAALMEDGTTVYSEISSVRIVSRK